MFNSVLLICKVATADKDSANVIAKALDPEPKSLGLFFTAFNATGDHEDDATHYIDSIDVRPGTMQVIRDYVDGVTDNEETEDQVAALLAIGPKPASLTIHDSFDDATSGLKLVEA